MPPDRDATSKLEETRDINTTSALLFGQGTPVVVIGWNGELRIDIHDSEG